LKKRVNVTGPCPILLNILFQHARHSKRWRGAIGGKTHNHWWLIALPSALQEYNRPYRSGPTRMFFDCQPFSGPCPGNGPEQMPGRYIISLHRSPPMVFLSTARGCRQKMVTPTLGRDYSINISRPFFRNQTIKAAKSRQYGKFQMFDLGHPLDLSGQKMIEMALFPSCGIFLRGEMATYLGPSQPTLQFCPRSFGCLFFPVWPSRDGSMMGLPSPRNVHIFELDRGRILGDAYGC